MYARSRIFICRDDRQCNKTDNVCGVVQCQFEIQAIAVN